MIPKLIFRRSWLYDQALTRRGGYKMPTDKVLDNHVRRIEKDWAKLGDQVLKRIAGVTKLYWYEKEIVCYVTFGVIPYSDPLTLNLQSDVHTLTHELIHRILSEPENWKRIKGNWAKCMKKYSKYPLTTRGHIVVHAIHAAIIKNLFGEKVLEKEKNVVRDPEYIRSWKIVDTDGYESIIKQIFFHPHVRH